MSGVTRTWDRAALPWTVLIWAWPIDVTPSNTEPWICKISKIRNLPHQIHILTSLTNCNLANRSRCVIFIIWSLCYRKKILFIYDGNILLHIVYMRHWGFSWAFREVMLSLTFVNCTYQSNVWKTENKNQSAWHKKNLIWRDIKLIFFSSFDDNILMS